MKLFKISQRDYPGYTFVVRHESEIDARKFVSPEPEDEEYWLDPKEVDCEEITLNDNDSPQLILHSEGPN